MEEMKAVFQTCQDEVKDKPKLLRQLSKCYDSMELDEFWESFVHLLKYSMVVYEREPSVERILNFCVKFVVSVRDEKSVSEGKDDEMSHFLVLFFNFLLENHDACSRAVRYRVCQLINKLLSNMGDDANIDDQLFERICKVMLERIRDKFPLIRAEAAQAMSRLQDPSDKGCPVISAFLFMMERDPKVIVRKSILNCIAASKKTLPGIINRTHDVDPMVRTLAYKILADKVSIKGLSISQRIQLLMDGLKDRSATVQVSTKKLLKTWFRTCDENVVQFLSMLDVEDSIESAELALKTLFTDADPSHLIEAFDLLNDRYVIDNDKLASESALYWRCLYLHMQSLGAVGDEYLDKLTPTLIELCQYVQQYMLLWHPNATATDIDDVEREMQKEFVSIQLLSLLGLQDHSDLSGRNALLKLVNDLLMSPVTSSRLVEPLLSLFNNLNAEEDKRVQQLVEIIAEIQAPSMDTTTTNNETAREKEIELATVRASLAESKHELERLVTEERFTDAAKIKEKVSFFQKRKEQLLMETAEPQPSQDVPTEKSDPDTMLKCLTIAKIMVQHLNRTSLSPSLQSLLEVLVLPSITNEDPAVRLMAMECLGLYCLLSRDLAKSQFYLFMQILHVDHVANRVSALQLIFDMLLMFGIDTFRSDDKTENEQCQTPTKNSEEMSEDDKRDISVITDSPLQSLEDVENQNDRNKVPDSAAGDIISIIQALLDGECADLRCVAAEGTAKLMLAGRLSSAEFFSHLLLLWYNPVTVDDATLRHCLGSFFQVFSFASRANQEIVMEAFLPTVRTLFTAPAFSPLSEVNETNVADLMIILCDGRRRVNPAETNEDNLHERLALKIVNEILNDPDSFGTLTLTKALNQLNITGDNTTMLEDLRVLTEEMLDTVKNKQCVKQLEKFNGTIEALCAEKTLQDGQSQNEQMEITTECEKVGGSQVSELGSQLEQTNLEKSKSGEAAGTMLDSVSAENEMQEKGGGDSEQISSASQLANTSRAVDESISTREEDVFASPGLLKQRPTGLKNLCVDSFVVSQKEVTDDIRRKARRRKKMKSARPQLSFSTDILTEVYSSSRDDTKSKKRSASQPITSTVPKGDIFD